MSAAQSPSPPLWLGVDLSTQSLTLVLLPDQQESEDIYYLDSVRYATDLPQYATEHGMHIADGDDGEKASLRCYLGLSLYLPLCGTVLILYQYWGSFLVWGSCLVLWCVSLHVGEVVLFCLAFSRETTQS